MSKLTHRQQVEKQYRQLKGSALTAADHRSIDLTLQREEDARRNRSALAEQMGVSAPRKEPRLIGNRQVFPVMNRAEASAWLKSRESRR